MDIRTRLVFAFFAVTIGSLLTFGYLAHGIAERLIGAGTIDQLESLAGSGSDALEGIVEGWQERVQLIGSRTQLRASLDEYGATGDSAALAVVQRILDDAVVSVRSVAAIAVYDRRGNQLTSAGTARNAPPELLTPRSTSSASQSPLFLEASPSGEAYPEITYSMPLLQEGRRVGFLFVVLNGDRLVELTTDTTGLGRSGELMVVAPDPSGARTLHPVRHPLDGFNPEGPILLTGEQDPALMALSGVNGVEREGLEDYRGRSVWAATRFLPYTGWGLVVKYDADERRAGIDEFWDEMIALALALSGIGLLVALVLGLRFAGPIHDLAETANRIREGDLSARAPVRREDEIGVLARTFNQTADELQHRMLELHEFQKFFDVSLDLLCIAGTDGYFKRTNPAFTTVLGWSEEELLSRPFLDLVHPDDVVATTEQIERLAEGQPAISFVNRFRRSDGSWIYLKWNAYPEEESGLMYAVARETSARPQSDA
ncbi:MAG: HAMP domain-containing protein [marine benthic group bacterium]|nr:HAMP domain-containing protein [Gemmatimonadota bacterium]